MTRLKYIVNLFVSLAFCTPLKADIIKPLNHIHENSSFHLWNISSADQPMEIQSGTKETWDNTEDSHSAEQKASAEKSDEVITATPSYDSDRETLHPTKPTKSSHDTEAKLKILNVGQGNFVVLEVPGAPGAQPQILVVDGGSSSRGTIAFTSNQETKTVKGLGAPTPSNVGKENVHKSFTDFGKTSADQLTDALKLNILGGRDISIKTIVLTHADLDHYNLLDKVFANTEVENIILSGDILSYKEKFIGKNGDPKKFLDWLEKKHGKGAKIFMPGASYQAIPTGTTVAAFIKANANNFAPTAYKGDDDKFHIVDEEKEIHFKNSIKKINQHYTISKEFAEAFNFGKDIKIYPLSINPLRTIGVKPKSIEKENQLLRKTVTEHDYADGLDKVNENDDSTVIKIVNGRSSALLTGDATKHTYESIKDNFKGKLEFLKSKVLLLSHHGTETEDSNSKDWLELIEPEFVAISNGTTHDSMKEIVFDKLIALKSLLTLESKPHLIKSKSMQFLKESEPIVKPSLVKSDTMILEPNAEAASPKSESHPADFHHKLEISKGSKKNKNYIIRETHKFIFTTLSSGNLLFELMKDGKIELEMDNNVVDNSGKREQNIQRIIYTNYGEKYRIIETSEAEYKKSIMPRPSTPPIETASEEGAMEVDANAGVTRLKQRPKKHHTGSLYNKPTDRSSTGR